MTSAVEERSWAWVAGASEGLGLAFAEALAARGHGVLMIARRAAPLRSHADRIRVEYRVPVIECVLDLAAPDLADRLAERVADAPPCIAVYNAAFGPIGDFLERPLPDLLRVVDVNVRGPLIWARILGGAMALQHAPGCLVFMSSLAGEQGSPRIATYAATKAFVTRLAEGLWAELRNHGIDVLVCCAGAIGTPGYERAARSEAPGQMTPEEVVRETLEALGSGPRVVPGWRNRLAALLLGRWLPRSTAVRVMGRVTGRLEISG